ncbi:MAG: tyrosine protein kinase [Bacteroidales bacterium]|nr:tyrosine protein kinase [Bacteroidales bacterium]OPZ98945.1 MAG: 3-deoxy-D-manno-octulosonic-acid kinase [Bacteroidetes bacterium ADurb.Bin416]
MIVVLQPAFSALSDFIYSLPDRFEKEGYCLYKGRNELRVFDVNGLRINVKAFKRPNYLNRIVYSFLRPSKARRSYENSIRMTSLGFDVPAPIAYMEIKKRGLLDRSYFVSLQCPYTNNFRCFGQSPLTEALAFVPKAFGTYVANMHEAGVLHKDLSIGNVLFEVDQEQVRFCLVDLNRMQFGAAIGLEKGCKNVNRLRGDEAFFKQMAHSYADARGFDPTVCFEIMLCSARKSQQWFRRKSVRKQRLRKLTEVRKRLVGHFKA